MIKLEDCKKQYLYKINSRNLSHGVYDGNGGFIGIRTKFHDRFLFTEYHYDYNEHGTVEPEIELYKIPDSVDDTKLFEYLNNIR